MSLVGIVRRVNDVRVFGFSLVDDRKDAGQPDTPPERPSGRIAIDPVAGLTIQSDETVDTDVPCPRLLCRTSRAAYFFFRIVTTRPFGKFRIFGRQ